MINICMAIYNKDGVYSKYTATTITSVVMNTNHKVHFYLLCDETLLDIERRKIEKIVEKNGSVISFLDVDSKDFELDTINITRFTIGTLYRMKMVEILPKEIKRIIYLDSDIVVNLDIRELWDLDLEKNAIAGVLERDDKDCLDDADYKILDDGLVDNDFYINAGVMVLDLVKIKSSCDLYNEGMRFIRQHPMYLNDQDAINFLFSGRILVLNKKYNYYSVRSRIENETDGKKIYHFSADCPRDVSQYYVDRLFAYYYKMSNWHDKDFFEKHFYMRAIEKEKEKKRLLLLLKSVFNSQKKVVFWGIKGAPHKKIMKYFSLKPEDYFVDISVDAEQQLHMEHEVKNPNSLVAEDLNNTMIVSTINRYSEVVKMAEAWGFKDGINMFDGRLLLTEEESFCTYGNRDCKWDIGEV